MIETVVKAVLATMFAILVVGVGRELWSSWRDGDDPYVERRKR